MKCSELYADMLEHRMQMYEGVPFAHLKFQSALSHLQKELGSLRAEDRGRLLGLG